jgi:hypothetical protein
MAKTLILGIRHQTGIAKESGKPYDLRPAVIIGTPMRPVSNEKLTLKAAGVEGVQVECTAEVWQQLGAIPGGKFPIVAEVGFEVIPTRDGSTARVTSVNVAG